MPFGPEASPLYDLMSGVLIWEDEWPKPEALPNMLPYKFLIVYRDSLIRGTEHTEWRFLWEQVQNEAPRWPGLRPERQGAEHTEQLLKMEKQAEGDLLREFGDGESAPQS